MKKIGLIGSTGLVGLEMLDVLEQRGYQDWELLPAASSRSVGHTTRFNHRKVQIMSIEDLLASRPDFVLNATEAQIAQRWARRFTETGAYFIDNSSAWRMVDEVPLVVPEVNKETISKETHLIANPNCSTIQMVMVLAPLHKVNRIRRVHVTTFQAVSGSGTKGLHQLDYERSNQTVTNPAYPHPIDMNCLPHCDDFLDNLYTKEEMKLINETRKILNDPEIQISATAVRVPVRRGHSEALAIDFERPMKAAEVRDILQHARGVVVQDNPRENIYPMAFEAQGTDNVYVGRIREDLASPVTGVNMWIVADNLRKGAATNAIQILDRIVEITAQ